VYREKEGGGKERIYKKNDVTNHHHLKILNLQNSEPATSFI